MGAAILNPEADPNELVRDELTSPSSTRFLAKEDCLDMWLMVVACSCSLK